MKSTLRIVGGLSLLFALLTLGWATDASAQGPTPTSTPAPGAACTDVATFVSDVTIADNTVVAPGQAFTKTWRMRNRGTCTWGPNYTFAHVSGPAMTSQTSVAVPQTAPVATADLTVQMTAPTTAGAAQGFWQLRSPSGKAFGPRVWVNVGGGAPVPAQAPALVPTGVNFDDPARAINVGNPIFSLTPGTAEWVRFAYDNADNALPRPTVSVVLLNGVTNGLTFQVYSPETMVGNWFDNTPVGRGTPERVENCIENALLR